MNAVTPLLRLYQIASQLGMSAQVGDVGLRQNQRFAGNAHDALVGSAASPERELATCIDRDIHADDCKIAAIKFQDIGAAAERRSHRSIRVRVGSESTLEHDALLTIVSCHVNNEFVNVATLCPKPIPRSRFRRKSRGCCTARVLTKTFR